MKFKILDISELKGLVLSSIDVIKSQDDSDEIYFYTVCGRVFKMYHERDCCETVVIEDICGEIEWLIGSPILISEERSNEKENDETHETWTFDDAHETWTFYEFSTIKGSVTIRWYGSSNGYYSESVDFQEIINEN
jgi:hypothetical protein